MKGKYGDFNEKIYMGKYRENKSLQDESDPSTSCPGPVCPVGTYFPECDRRSIHYGAYYTVTCQHERKNLTQYVFLQLICCHS